MIKRLHEIGIISTVLGGTPEHILSLTFPTWAYREPKPFLGVIVAICNKISSCPVNILVDDVCAVLVTDRDIKQQELVNQMYREYFSALNARVVFTSTLYGKEFRHGLIDAFATSGKDFKFKVISESLPRDKREKFPDIFYLELLHSFIELTSLTLISKFSDSLIMSDFNRRMATAYRQVNEKPLPVILLSKITSIDETLGKLQNLNLL